MKGIVLSGVSTGRERIGWLLVGYTSFKHFGSLSNCLQGQDIQGSPVGEWLQHSHGLLSGPSQTAAIPEQNALCSSFWLLLQRTRQFWVSVSLQLPSASQPALGVSRSLKRSKANPPGGGRDDDFQAPGVWLSILMLSAAVDKSSKAVLDVNHFWHLFWDLLLCSWSLSKQLHKFHSLLEGCVASLKTSGLAKG